VAEDGQGHVYQVKREPVHRTSEQLPPAEVKVLVSAAMSRGYPGEFGHNRAVT